MINKKEVEGGKIITVKDFTTPEQATMLWNRANDDSYSFGHNSDSRSGKRQARWVQRFGQDFAQSDLWVNLAKQIDSPVVFIEAYINYAEFSTVTLPHCDNIQNGATILICLNQEWNRDWGGYTVFFERMSGSDISKAVCPEPGQAVIFNGSIWHCALPPNILAPCPRFMLAIKFNFVDVEKDSTNTEEE